MKAKHKHIYDRVLIRHKNHLHLIHKCQVCGKEREPPLREQLSQLNRWLFTYEEFIEVYGPLTIIDR